MECKEAPLITAYVIVSGHSFDPDACTETVGLEPTRVWRQTRKWLLDHPDIPNGSWSVGVGKVPSYSLDETVTAALEIVWPSRVQLKRFVQSNDVELSIGSTVTIHAERPVYDLSVGVMKRLVYLGADFFLDIFDYSNDDS